ncbi:MAG: putative Ig domain-containing protein [Bacteroidia bacterium]
MGYLKKRKEVVAQFRYFDVYSRNLSQRKNHLIWRRQKSNGMSMNYFVMLQPAVVSTSPEINISQLPDGAVQNWYQASLTALYGFGKFQWELIEGELPKGLYMGRSGNLKGIPREAGVFSFTVQAVDEKDQVSEAEVILKIE